MQVLVQPLFSSDEGTEVIIETNSEATIQTVISSFCAKKGIAFNAKLAIFDGAKRPLPAYSTLQSLGIGDKQNLYIGYRDNSQSLETRWPLIVALVALVIGVVGILSMSLTYGLTGGGEIPLDYGVMMDAGSTKTKTLLYSWPGNKHKGTGCVTQEKICTVGGGGIAKLIPGTIDKILHCTTNVTEVIPENSVSVTPLYFAATAGMRLLNLTSSEDADKVLTVVSNRLNDTGLSVRDVSIISGKDEGIYGWITVNFLKHTLEAEIKTDPWIPTTYGALDMGGASAQIAYTVPPSQVNKSSSKIQTMELYGQEFHVFGKSDLCFGRDEAARRYHALLVKDPSVDVIDDPCAPVGYNETNTGDYYFYQPCTLSKNFQQWKSAGDFRKKKYTFKGTSDYRNCALNITRLLNIVTCKQREFKECFQTLERPLVDQKFIAFATYFYTTNFLNLTDSSLEEYESAIEKFCAKPYSEIGGGDYGGQYCFNARYIYELLTSGYGFDNVTWRNLAFFEELDGKDLGWSLGYMINATNLIPEKAPSARLISASALTVCLLIFIVAVLATSIFLFHKLCRKSEDTTTQNRMLYSNP